MLIAERNAESSVLGGLLVKPEAFDEVSHLEPSDFSSQANQRIYRAIYQMIHDGEAVDVFTVHNKVKNDTDLAYMTGLITNTPSVANISHYANIVKEHAQRRGLSAVAHELSESVYGDVRLAADTAQAQIEAVMGVNEKNEPVLAADDLIDYLDEFERRKSGEGTAVFATGFADLDRMLNGGIRGGDIIMIAARPKCGKAQPVWSKVLLKDGNWKPIGELKIGDELASVDGKPSVVTGVYPQGVKPIYEMAFSDGRKTHSCGEHLWQVGNRKWSEDRVLSTKEIIGLLEKPSMKRRLYVPTFDGAHGGNELPINPYALGAPRVNFESITPAGNELCVCISVSHPSKLYITDDYIVTHNTTLAMNIAVNIARNHNVLFLSQEMRRRDLHDRNIARLGKVPLSWLLRPNEDDDLHTRMIRAIEIIQGLKLHVDDQGALTPMDVRLKARAVKRKHGLDVLVIDYLQLMRGSNVGKNDSRNNEVESIMRSLKALALEMDIPIILLSQLNRSLESRTNKRPMPSDFRDSGSVEQDCSVALMLYRDEVYDEDSPDKGICEVNVALNRQGETGTIGMQFNGATSSFSDLAHNTLFGLAREAEEEKHKPKYSSRDRAR